MDFQISLSLWELQVFRDSLCVRDIAETSLNRFVTIAYLKKQAPSYSVENGAPRNFTGKQLC